MLSIVVFVSDPRDNFGMILDLLSFLFCFLRDHFSLLNRNIVLKKSCLGLQTKQEINL